MFHEKTLASTAWIGAVLGLLCLWLLDVAQQAPVSELDRIENPEKTRLVVLFVDSLAARDVVAPTMPKLAARLEHSGFHGPVRSCADAITVPCMLAAITGNDRLSIFALGTNFAGAGGAIESSVLGQLQRAGHPVGYIGERMLAKPFKGLSHSVANLKSDAEVIRLTTKALKRADLAVLIAHFSSLDQTAHEHTASSREYKQAALRMDTQLDDLMRQVSPTDHVLVMGDHGHTLTGRHAAGLEATTYAAFFGPQFSRAMRYPMAITDHAAIWARIFGYKRGSIAWLEDYYAGRELPARSGLPEPTSGARLPAWAVLLCGLFICLISLARDEGSKSLLPSARRVAWFAGAALTMAILGSMWFELRTMAWQSGGMIFGFAAASTLLTALLGACLVRFLPMFGSGSFATWEGRYIHLLTGSILFAIPTVYWLGGPSVMLTWFALGLLVIALWRLARREPMQALYAGAAFLIAVTTVRVKLANYVVLGFPFYTKRTGLFGYSPLLFSSVLFVSALLVSGVVNLRRPVTWLLPCVGVAAAACVGHVPYLWLSVPCVLALPLVLGSFRFAVLRPFAVACVVPAIWFLFQRHLTVVAPILAAWLSWALFSRVFADRSDALRGAALTALLVMTFWTSMGCRITGIDFDFFFRFLPKGVDVTQHWFLQTVFTVIKYMIPPAFGMLLAQSGDPRTARALHVSAWVARARLGTSLLFLIAVSVTHHDAGTAMLGDATQEAAFWVLALLTLSMLIAALPKPSEPILLSQVPATPP